MEKIYTATATSKGGRGGHVRSADGLIDMELRYPKELGGEGGAYVNPEELFAAGYSACFNSALMLAAKRRRINADDAEVTVAVGIGRDDDGASFKLSADISAKLFDVSEGEAKLLMAEAHRLCPYSKATRGNIDVNLGYELAKRH